MLLVALLACTEPQDPPVGEVLVADEDRSEVVGKGILLNLVEAPLAPAIAVLLDSDGVVRWRRSLGGDVLRARIPATGDGILVLLKGDQDGPARVQRETLEGALLSVTDAGEGHHDVLQLADGRLAWLEHIDGIAYLPADPEAPINTDVVMVAPEGGAGEPVFSFFDDYLVDPFWVCDHMKKGQRIPGYYQWTHSNSLVQAPGRDDELGVLSRNLDALVWFDLATGAVREQVGGLQSTLDLGDEGLDHPHMSHAPTADTVLVFDNRLHSQEDSRVVELRTDRDAGTAQVVWSYDHPEVGNVGFLGDARRLPGGNTLIAFTDERRLTEVTPEGEIVWEFVMDGIKHLGRVQLWDGELP